MLDFFRKISPTAVFILLIACSMAWIVDEWNEIKTAQTRLQSNKQNQGLKPRHTPQQTTNNQKYTYFINKMV